MKNFFLSLLLVATIVTCAHGQAVIKPATQAQANAGVSGTTYITPKTLKVITDALTVGGGGVSVSNVNYLIFSSAPTFNVEGDSLSAITNGSLQGSNTWANYFKGKVLDTFGSTNFFNWGVEADYADNMPAEYPSQAGSVHSTGRDYFLLLAGVNNLGRGDAAGTIYGALSNCWRLARLDGKRVVAFTITPNFGSLSGSTYSNKWVDVNTAIIASSNLWDVLIPTHTLISQADTVGSGDILHWSTAASIRIAQYVIQTLLGMPTTLQADEVRARLATFETVSYALLTADSARLGGITNSGRFLNTNGASAGGVTVGIYDGQITVDSPAGKANPTLRLIQAGLYGAELYEENGTGLVNLKALAIGAGEYFRIVSSNVTTSVQTTNAWFHTDGSMRTPGPLRVDSGSQNLDLKAESSMVGLYRQAGLGGYLVGYETASGDTVLHAFGNVRSRKPFLQTNSFSTGQTFYGQGTNFGGYTLQLRSYTSFSPADATTYYCGDLDAGGNGFSGTSGNRQVYIPRAGAIRRITAHVFGTAGTSETVSTFVRLNEATDYGQLDMDWSTIGSSIYAATDVYVPVVQGDRICLKIVAPTWATNPTAVLVRWTVYID